VENPWIRDIKHLPEIFSSSAWAFKNVPNYYRPLVNIVYMLDYNIFGLTSWGFHLTNVILHTGVSVLVFLVTALLINKPQPPQPQSIEQCNATPAHALAGAENLTVPFVAALLFAVHPIHTEAVAWASGVQDVSFTFFYLLSFYFYLKTEGVWGKGFVLSLVFFFFAALSKEPALTLPILLIAYDYSFKRDSILHPKPETIYLLLKRYLPYMVVAGIYLILRTYAIGGVAPVKAHTDLSAYQYFINVFPLFAQYLGKLILPVNLNAAYVFHPIHSLLEWRGILAVAVTVGFIVILYFAKNRNKVAFFSLLWMVIPLLPVFYIPALGEHTFAERYLYLPSVGFVILVSLGIFWVGRLDVLKVRAKGYFVLSAVLIIAGLYSTGTVKRTPVWRDELTLWSDTVKKSPDSYISHNNLGFAYNNMGRTDEAIAELILALRLKPDYAKAHNNLGNSYYEQGRIYEAIVEYKEAIRLKPDHAKAHNNLGLAYDMLGRTDEAIVRYRVALRLKPDFVDAHINLGLAYVNQGLTDEAVEELREAIRLEPDSAEAHNNLGNLYAAQGLTDEAIREFRKTIRLKPDNADAHYNLGLAYIEKGLKNEAIREFEEVLRLNPQDAVARHALKILSK
jgi:tetratricopeptide (TPR) repeat protein